MMQQSNDKVALVTGGSRGIGRGIAIALAAFGVSVALTYSRNQQLAEAVCSEIVQTGGIAVAVQMQSEERLSIQHALAEVESQCGVVDILVNNAAISQEKPFATITDEDWDRMLAVNLRGPFCCTQEVLPQMLEKGWGRIINISSIGGQWGGFNQVHYAASKAALLSFTQSIAKIYSSLGVTSNAVSPGLVQTDMAAAELDSEAGKQKVAGIPMGRIGTVREIADIVVFLASDAASYVTGQTINVNGGMYFG